MTVIPSAGRPGSVEAMGFGVSSIEDDPASGAATAAHSDGLDARYAPPLLDESWALPDGRSDTVRWPYVIYRATHPDVPQEQACEAVGAPLGMTARQVKRRLAARPYQSEGRQTRGQDIKGGPRKRAS